MTMLIHSRSERGVAMIAALFLTVILSLIASSLVVVARTETMSTLNYKTMSQGRYGAESGVHAAANHLLYTYAAPGTALDPLANYNVTVSPVTFNGAPVVLSSDPDVPSNYPIAAVTNAFAAATQGSLNVQDALVNYSARATLTAMRQVVDSYSGQAITVQTWEITGVGALGGAGSADIEVSAVIDRQIVPAYRYAAFATSNGCASLSFAGGATTDSYDSQAPLVGGFPVLANSDGHVGSNGNLDEVGNPTTINGTLSTPRSGVGACTENNVTAATITGNAAVTGGLVQLPQEVTFPTPAAPDPLPPTGNDRFNGGACPGGVMACNRVGNTYTVGPAPMATTVTLGNVTLNGGVTVRLQAGTYIVNSLTLAGNSSIVIDSGPVIFKIAGQHQNTPVDLTGGSVSNGTFDPMQLQFVYGGTGELRLNGGTQAAALVYAPRAETSLSGGADFYGSVITGRLTATGGSALHFDRRLLTSGAMTAGNFTMNSFTWKAF